MTAAKNTTGPFHPPPPKGTPVRRLRTALPVLAVIASLAFAPVTTVEEEEAGPTLDLTATTDGTAASGTLAFGGAATVSTDDAGDPAVPMAGLDVGDVRMEQVGGDLVVSLDVLDATEGEVAPTALYKIDMTSNLSLMAFRGPDAWNYQVADFSEGYASSDAAGEFDGSTITWTVPATTFGSAGSSLVARHVSSQGISPAGGLFSVQLSGFVTTDAGSPIAQFLVGGRVDLTVADADGTQVASGIAFADAAGDWSHDLPELAPGTYTLTADAAYATLEQTAATEFVIE